VERSLIIVREVLCLSPSKDEPARGTGYYHDLLEHGQEVDLSLHAGSFVWSPRCRRSFLSGSAPDFEFLIARRVSQLPLPRSQNGRAVTPLPANTLHHRFNFDALSL
jgi:hypothetical protein